MAKPSQNSSTIKRPAIFLLSILLSSCATKLQNTEAGIQKKTDLAELWSEPKEISKLDLFYGPGGPKLVPKETTIYKMKSVDHTGHSGGYDVVDPEGRLWDVKTGEEAQSETVVSRLLWAVGYQQPITYYVARWTMSGGKKMHPEPGRFRLEADHEFAGEWAWEKNPFVGLKPFRGLIVANLIVNNWDIRTANNALFRISKPKVNPSLWYVVQDVGGSLGKTSWPIGTRNVIRDFETQKLIDHIGHGSIKFDYHARHKHLLRDIEEEDIVWICRLFAQLSDQQLDDAFRAAEYSADIRGRYVRKIKEKVQEGLDLSI